MPAAPLFALSLLSASALGYELLLMRLFSIIQWHHFAYVMISVAVLGYGAAGAMVALAQRWLAPRFAAVFVGGALLFGVFSVASFALAQRVAFNPLEILWDPREPLRLLLIVDGGLDPTLDGVVAWQRRDAGLKVELAE
jgi:hypothetical protein